MSPRRRPRARRREDLARRPGLEVQPVAKAEVYRPFDEAFEPLADQILGPGGWTRVTPPGPLITFPEPGSWTLPHKIWHFDLPARGTIDPPIALRLLGFVERVAPAGGGTIVVEGVPVCVTELVGDPGDAFLMHPWLLHGLAPSAGERVRSMFTHTLYGAGFRFTG